MNFCSGSRENAIHQTVPRGSGSVGVPVLTQMFLTNVPRLVEHLDALALAIADVNQSGAAHRDAVHDLRERAARAGLDFLLRRLLSPLAQELSVAVEHRHAPVAVSVGDVDIAVRGIDDDAGGIEELRAAGVEQLPFGRAVRRIEDAALADLQQQLSVVSSTSGRCRRRCR